MKATKIAHWPNQDVPCCDEHAAQIKGVGEAIGLSVSFSDVTEDAECVNCQTEQGEG